MPELPHTSFPSQPPVLPPLTYAHNPLPKYADEINMNGAVLDAYCGAGGVLDLVTEPGDDNNYGSSALNDVACLQALSPRVHFGKFVAEAKYRETPQLFDAAIAAGDADAVMAALTHPDQEAAVAARVARKAATFGASIAEGKWMLECPMILADVASCADVACPASQRCPGRRLTARR